MKTSTGWYNTQAMNPRLNDYVYSDDNEALRIQNDDLTIRTVLQHPDKHPLLLVLIWRPTLLELTLGIWFILGTCARVVDDITAISCRR